MREILTSVPMMLLLTFGSYLLGVWVRKKSGLELLHPMITCLPVLIAVLVVFDIPAEQYMEANKFVSFMLGPCVVALGLKLYDHRKLIMENALPIGTAVIAGCIVGVGSVILLGRLAGLPEEMILSLEPKSVTAPIAIDIISSLGGNVSLAAVTVFLVGVLGAYLGPTFLNILHIKNPIARGAGIGCSSHGMGTARAIEESALEGAVSGLCIALMGTATAILVPLINSL
jgi:Putative effector of murein hydrolase